MPTRKTKPEIPQYAEGKKINLATALSKKAAWRSFGAWVVGDSPLICHAWSQKAKLEMLTKQVKATRGGREARDPEGDFVSSLYEMREGVYGFPCTGLKNAIMSAAHKDKGIAKTNVLSALFLDADMVSVRPALAGAICDMPLVRLYASEPQMREDMVKVGLGLNKTASLAYRAQFTHWGIRLTGRLNIDVLTPDALAFLVSESGISAGLGEWRNEKRGLFGAYHMADDVEQEAWEAFAKGRGPLPMRAPTLMAAE